MPPNRDTHDWEFPYTPLRGFPTARIARKTHAACMTQARSQLAPPGTPGFFHCVQRCVRRAFLCGQDAYTGQSFDHRKDWVEQRIAVLSESFAIAIHAYAVMSNHLHLVIELAPDVAEAWSDHDVAMRWVRLFPPRERSDEASQAKCRQLIAQPDKLQTIRARLASLSWFMRCLAEPIARRANREDGCTGRFWEGRFRMQRLCDERAVLAAMTYVDLNPVRAGIATELHDSTHTSVSARLPVRKSPDIPHTPLDPVLGIRRTSLSISQAEYLALLDWTGRQLTPGRHGKITAPAPQVLSRIAHDPQHWTRQVLGIGNRYWRAVGNVEALIALAKDIGQQWLKGLGFAASMK